MNYTVELNVPFADKIMPFLFDKAIIKQTHDGKIEHVARKYLYRCTDLEIVSSYNSECVCQLKNTAKGNEKIQQPNSTEMWIIING